MPTASALGVEILHCVQDDMGGRSRSYGVYILASRTRVLYVGVTNDLARRLAEHKAGTAGTFTTRYRVDRLVYCEEHPSIRDAIAREKAIKGWRRERKVALVESTNPAWADLATGSEG